jgi:hypothetical protein
MQKTMMRCAWLGLIVIAIVGLCVLPGAAQRPAKSAGMPVFQVDSTWPTLPNNWVVGIVSAVTVDKRDHVWILHRPRSVAAELKGRAAPPVLEFDADGKFVNAWGGDGSGYDWPTTEHGITIDSKDVVWIGGSGVGDDMLLNFTLQGKFLREFGKARESKGNADTGNVNRPADIFVDAKTNEAYVADGYGNRRVAVFDAATGKFKRMWGAFGNPPDSDPPAGGFGGGGGERGAAAAGGGRGRGRGADAAPALDTEGDGAKVLRQSRPRSEDLERQPGLRRGSIQPAHPGVHTSRQVRDAGVHQPGRGRRRARWPDSRSRPIRSNSSSTRPTTATRTSPCSIARRSRCSISLERAARSPGDFQGPHHIAVDSKGNLYVAEVAPGNRAQKFLLKGMSPTPPPNALTAAQLAPAP